MIRETRAAVDMRDRIVLFGEGCFDTIRIHRGAPFRLDAHLRRLRESMEILGIAAPMSLATVREGLRAVVERNRLEEGLVRITVTAGNPDADLAESVLLAARQLPRLPERIVLHVAESVRRVPGPLSRCKTTSRAAEALALREAKRTGAFDAILLNPHGNVVETTARNLFAVSGEVVRTPPASEGALEGITRDLAIELARKVGLEAKESALEVPAILHADEVFLTGSGVGILGVHRIHARTFERVPGPVTADVARAYDDVLDRESKW